MSKILIIDDDTDLVEAIKVILESKDYEVSFASSGAEGLKKAKEETPDLIILDVMMEHQTSGFETARAIKQDEASKNIPIIMLTAVMDETGLDFSKEAGDDAWLPVDEYIEKPLDPESFIAKIEKLLN